MISRKLALEVLNVALSNGGDFAEIFLEETHSASYFVDNGKTQPPSTSLTYGAGIRILNNLQSVYGHTSDLSKKGLLALASSLSASQKGTKAVHVESMKKVRVSRAHSLEKSVETLNISEIIGKLKLAE